jgi:hypothetical protein
LWGKKYQKFPQRGSTYRKYQESAERMRDPAMIVGSSDQVKRCMLISEAVLRKVGSCLRKARSRPLLINKE